MNLARNHFWAILETRERPVTFGAVGLITLLLQIAKERADRRAALLEGLAPVSQRVNAALRSARVMERTTSALGTSKDVK